MDAPITRAEHLEFAKRIEDQQKRTDKRLELLEVSVQKIEDLTISVHELAVSTEKMAEAQINQDKRITEIESKDGKSWNEFKKIVISALASGILMFLLGYLGF